MTDSAEAFEDIKVTRTAEIVTIVLARPPLNLLRRQTWAELGTALADVRRVRPACLVIDAEGTRCFSAGADLRELRAWEVAQARAEAVALQQVLVDLESLPVPTIAAVRGRAIGGGFELASACTFRVLSTQASLSVPELGYGLVPGLGACYRLARLVGHARAAELVLTGQPVSAAQALAMGLATRVVAPGDVDAACATLAESFARAAPDAVAMALELLHSARAEDPCLRALNASYFALSAQRALDAGTITLPGAGSSP